jgi:hypothetical protein
VAFTPYAGTAGGVKYGAGSTAFVGITSWKLDKRVEVVKTTNFESTADGNGVVWETYLASLGSATGSLEGMFDGDTTNSEECIPIGTTVALDLFYRKAATAVGFSDVSSIITGISGSQDLRDVGKFSATFTVNGAPPVAA